MTVRELMASLAGCAGDECVLLAAEEGSPRLYAASARAFAPVGEQDGHGHVEIRAYAS